MTENQSPNMEVTPTLETASVSWELASATTMHVVSDVASSGLPAQAHFPLSVMQLELHHVSDSQCQSIQMTIQGTHRIAPQD